MIKGYGGRHILIEQDPDRLEWFGRLGTKVFRTGIQNKGSAMTALTMMAQEYFEQQTKTKLKLKAARWRRHSVRRIA